MKAIRSTEWDSIYGPHPEEARSAVSKDGTQHGLGPLS
jgi:hypothetical protein